MSSDLAAYYAQKRKSKADEREQDRLDRNEARKQDREDARARAELDARQRRETAAEAKRRKAERVKRWADRRKAVAAWLDTDADTAMVLPIMAVGMIAAVIFQVDALTKAGFGTIFAGLPMMVALVLELGAAAATVMTVRAARDGRPAGGFRTAMWGCALVAATINASHGWTMTVDGRQLYWPAAVLFVISMAGTGYWEMRSIGRHGTSRKTKAERAEDKARRRHAKERADMYKDVARRAKEIVLANPFGKVDEEKAWADAWMDRKGAPVGQYADVYKTRAAALKATTAARELADNAAVQSELEAFLDSLLRDGGDEGDTPAKGSPKEPNGGPSQGRTALGRKGKQSFGRKAPKTPEKPIDPTDVAKVAKLAEAFGGVDKLSARNVREILGGGSTEYVIRVRDAVKNPKGE